MPGVSSNPHRSLARRPTVPWPLVAVSLFALTGMACASGPEPVPIFDVMLGGETTALSKGRNAFELPARNLTNEERRTFEVGDSFFNQNWVTAPSSTDARDGLGPTMNAQSCSSCHSHDGRGQPPPTEDDPERGLLLRLSVAGPAGPVDHTVYGGQLQDRSILDVPAEGSMGIVYEEIPGKYPDGTTYSLRRPTYSVKDPAFGPLPDDVMISPRVGPATFGLGLLEAVLEGDILALADPEDEDGDGISGRPNRVWDERKGAVALGRFGWKANQPTLEQQAARAFQQDIGITSGLFGDENCPEAQTACVAAPSGGDPEIPDWRLERLTFYLQTLAVPAMRNTDDPDVIRGAGLFVEVGCAACHTPSFTTGDSHPVAPLRGQLIFPYTDMLLHDMGPGLADGRPDGLATGREWRTAPLWGIGLVETVNGHTMFLHDGRARSIEEAILWHGGEASSSLSHFKNLSRTDREALIKFLTSL